MEELKKELVFIREELEKHAEFIRVHEARWGNLQKAIIELKESSAALVEREAVNRTSAVKVNRVLNKIGSHEFSIQHYDKAIKDINKYNTGLSKRLLFVEKMCAVEGFKKEFVIGIESSAEGSISELDIPVRAYNCLLAIGVRTISDLVLREGEELLRIKNFGRGSLRIIKEQLAGYGLRLGMCKEDQSL